MHGNLKDFLHECKDTVEKLNHRAQIAGSRRSQFPSVSSCYPALVMREKIPLSQQSSVFSESSHSSRMDVFSTAACPSPDISSHRGRCLTQDSGFGGETKPSVSSQVTHDYINCKGLLYMEDVSNFALQIACGLQHLEKLKVKGPVWADYFPSPSTYDVFLFLQIAHCDLAARNVLISEGFVLKIGDFGMAREHELSDNDQYKRKIEQVARREHHNNF